VLTVLRHPAGDAGSEPEVGAADHRRVEAVGRRQRQLLAVRPGEVERADVDRHRGGGFADDQLHQLARLLRRGRFLGEALQEVELPDGVLEILPLDDPHPANVRGEDGIPLVRRL